LRLNQKPLSTARDVPMAGRRFALIFALCSFAATVKAASNADVLLPSLALNPPPSPSSSIWSGLYIGSGIFAISGNGSKGHVGGDGEIGYDHAFQNGLVVGVDAVGGYSPGLWANGPAKGFDFAETDVKVGYDMGRWMPYVETGAVLARPNLQPGANYVSVGQSADDLFSGPGHLRAAPRVGAGVEYAVTPNLHLDVNVSGGSGAALADPFGP
jgi:outer membrane immunogenic protein